jgi:hypothetical protein
MRIPAHCALDGGMGASGAFLAGRDCARVLFCGMGFRTYRTNRVSRAFLWVVSVTSVAGVRLVIT